MGLYPLYSIETYCRLRFERWDDEAELEEINIGFQGMQNGLSQDCVKPHVEAAFLKYEAAREQGDQETAQGHAEVAWGDIFHTHLVSRGLEKP
ncbi:MAG: hypothetical protein ABIH34_01865 [Nanoarchaeota archaeon]